MKRVLLTLSFMIVVLTGGLAIIGLAIWSASVWWMGPTVTVAGAAAAGWVIAGDILDD